MPNPENLNKRVPFVKGDERINLKGRPKKYLTTLKEKGYTKSQVADTIRVLLSLNKYELKLVCESKTTNVLEQTVAQALLKSLDKGTLYSLETLLTRVDGQPKQEIDQRVLTRTIIDVKFSDKPEDEPTKS